MRLSFWHAAWVLCALIASWSCEKYKDPFSANNSAPSISRFEFKPDTNLPDASLRADGDSLKFKTGQTYPVVLRYSDAESKSKNRPLQARFSFVAGSGRVSSNKFSNPSGDGLTFEVPAQFDDEILVLPDRAGAVDLQLELSDGIKAAGIATASTMFFPNLKPLVRFQTQTGGEQNPPYGVDFNAANSVDRDGKISSYTWSFGDNSARNTSLSNTIHHEYLQSGSFTVRLIIKDDEGATDSLDQVVTTFNQQPIAALSVTPTTGGAPLTIIYNARGSRDRDGRIVAYDVTFGDGMSSQSDSGSHTYTRDSPANSPYAVQLTVRDNVGATNTQTIPVTVITPPVADFIWQRCDLGNVTFVSTSYDPMPPIDPIDNYEWNFGDGSPAQSGGALSTVQHEFPTSDVYNVSLTVRIRGVTGTVTKQVQIPCN